MGTVMIPKFQPGAAPVQPASDPHRGLPVSVSGVRRIFDGGVTALDGVDLSIPPGEFTALLGPSGCGKSTLLRLVAGLDRPTAGEVSIGANSDRRSVAFVFQDPHLMPWRSVLANVALPLELRHVGRAARREAALAAIEQVGLAEFAYRYPNQLSGGMRMRVSLARALVTDPKLLLLDEPFAALDELTRQRLDEQLHELWRDRHMTVLFVTHSVAEAVFLAQRCIVFTPRPGRIVLDHAMRLPEHRAGLLRTDAVFSAECRTLYEALEKGGAVI